jgi:hypothetical protein
MKAVPAAAATAAKRHVLLLQKVLRALHPPAATPPRDDATAASASATVAGDAAAAAGAVDAEATAAAPGGDAAAIAEGDPEGDERLRTKKSVTWLLDQLQPPRRDASDTNGDTNGDTNAAGGAAQRWLQRHRSQQRLAASSAAAPTPQQLDAAARFAALLRDPTPKPFLAADLDAIAAPATTAAAAAAAIVAATEPSSATGLAIDTQLRNAVADFDAPPSMLTFLRAYHAGNVHVAPAAAAAAMGNVDGGLRLVSRDTDALPAATAATAAVPLTSGRLLRAAPPFASRRVDPDALFSSPAAPDVAALSPLSQFRHFAHRQAAQTQAQLVAELQPLHNTRHSAVANSATMGVVHTGSPLRGVAAGPTVAGLDVLRRPLFDAAAASPARLGAGSDDDGDSESLRFAQTSRRLIFPAAATDANDIDDEDEDSAGLMAFRRS